MTDPVDVAADDRRQAVHAEDVGADHERREVGVAVVLHVRRGHRHHADHHRLRHSHGDEAEFRPGRGGDDLRRGADLTRGPHAVGRGIDAADHRQRVGAQAHPDDHRRDDEQHGGEQERSHELVETELGGDALLERGEQRSEDRAERADPDDGGDGAGLPVGRCEVGGDIALLERRRVTGAEQEHAGDEQWEDPPLPTERGDGRAEGADDQCLDEPDPPAVAARVCGERDRRQCRPECEGGTGHAGEPIGAEQVAGEQRDDGDHPRHRGLARNLCQSQRVERPTLQRRQIDAGSVPSHGRLGHVAEGSCAALISDSRIAVGMVRGSWLGIPNRKS